MPRVTPVVGEHLIRVHKLIHQARSRAWAKEPTGLEGAAYGVLFQLQAGPRRTSALADCLFQDISTVSRQAAALTTAGLVERVPDPDDGRAHLLTLTDAGRATVQHLRTKRDAWVAGLLQDWPAEDVQAFAGYLERLADALAAQAHDSLLPAVTLTDPTLSEKP